MKVVVVASSSLALTPPVGMAVVALIRGLGFGDELAVRAPRSGPPPSPVEQAACALAIQEGRKVLFVAPRGSGRDATFRRDYELVEGACQVHAFFPRGSFMEGGTAHVVHAAVQKGIPVAAWDVDEHGITLVAESDGES